MNRNSKTTQAALGHLRDCICGAQLVLSLNTNHRYVANFMEKCTWSRTVAPSTELGDKNYRPGASSSSASTVSQLSRLSLIPLQPFSRESDRVTRRVSECGFHFSFDVPTRSAGEDLS